MKILCTEPKRTPFLAKKIALYVKEEIWGSSRTTCVQRMSNRLSNFKY